MKSVIKSVLAMSNFFLIQSCASILEERQFFDLKIIIVGFDDERVELVLDGETIFNKVVNIAHPSDGIGDALTVQIEDKATLSVASESTSFTETVQVAEDVNVLVVRYADQFIIKPATEPLLLD